VTRHTICGAVCVYFLIGLTFANLYELIELGHHGSFIINTMPLTPYVTSTDLAYFSFVTLTTVGFGDVTAATSQARSIVVLESVTGVLYLAILVARMISALKLHHLTRDEEENN